MHKHGRDYYLSDIPLDEAIRKFDRALEDAGALRHTASESVAARPGKRQGHG